MISGKHMDAADALVKPWQAEIKPGDYFQKDSRLGFMIYGKILPEEEPRDPHVQHYRLSQAYSVVCEHGEMGDVHVSKIDTLIDESAFEEAKKRGWRIES